MLYVMLKWVDGRWICIVLGDSCGIRDDLRGICWVVCAFFDGLTGGAHCILRLNQDHRSMSLGHLQHGPHRNDRAQIG